MIRRSFIAGAVTAWPLAASAQPAARLRQIGILSPSSASVVADLGFIRALQDGLQERGYVEGRNIVIHYRWADLRYERLPILAAELVGLKVEALLTTSTPGARAAQAASATIPIVVVAAGDLVASGLVTSLARPGGNLTGQHIFSGEVAAKRLEIMKEAVPSAGRIAVLVNPANAAIGPVMAEMERAARTLRLDLVRIEAAARGGFEAAFAAMTRAEAQALVLIEEPVFAANMEAIATLAAAHRLPMIGPPEAKSAALIAFGVDLRDLWFRAASYVDRILKGAKPADLPIERATKFAVTVNLQRARALGLALPPSILLRADEVIE
jgi:putative ABC transport system substrate-binding protein